MVTCFTILWWFELPFLSLHIFDVLKFFKQLDWHQSSGADLIIILMTHAMMNRFCVHIQRNNHLPQTRLQSRLKLHLPLRKLQSRLKLQLPLRRLQSRLKLHLPLRRLQPRLQHPQSWSPPPASQSTAAILWVSRSAGPSSPSMVLSTRESHPEHLWTLWL